MRISVMGLISIILVFAQTAGGAPGWASPRPIGDAEEVFSYKFDRGDFRYGDIVTLRDGSKRLGKVMEWATQVLLFEADGRVVVFDVDDVEQFEFRRMKRHTARPDLPDLTVAYIERLPRDPSWHGHVVHQDGLDVLDIDPEQTARHPAIGSSVTFRVHVLNTGAVPSSEVPCRILMDSDELKMATIPPLGAGKEHVVEVSWAWQEGRHMIRVDVDPDGSAPEIVRWNNTFVEPIDALAVTVVVASDRYNEFKRFANIVDSFCFEDWVQYQIRVLNGLFVASVHPSSPKGIIERVRCDRIIVVQDPTDVQQRAGWAPRLHKEGKLDGLAEYAALWIYGPLSAGDALVYDALKVDWEGLQDLCGQLGLIDLAATDTTIQQCLVLDRHERYVQRRHLFPWRRTMMYTAGGFAFDERSAAFLNRTRGRPRGLGGDYQFQLPDKITVEVRSNVGTPLTDAQVDVFQLMSEGEHAGAIAGYGRGDPLFSARTGADGRLTLPDQPTPSHKTPGGYELRPNAFGKIATDGSNGLLLLRVGYLGSEEFHFLRLFDCNVAYLRGQTQEYVRHINTRFGTQDAPEPPPFAAVVMESRTDDEPPMHIRWTWPAGIEPKSAYEFRVYKRTSFAGDDAKPWTLAAIVGKENGKWILRADGTYHDEFRYDGPYSLDTFYAVSTVAQDGRESSLSATGYLAYAKDSIKLTMDFDAAYITLAGDGPSQMIRWDGSAGMQPYGVRTRRFKDYVPSFAGVAFAADGRMIVTDPVNHVLAFYDRGDLVELLPNRKWWPGFASDEPGEFYTPADVAVDDAGNIYVADQANDRVQILDSRGRFKAMLDEDCRFVGPHAVGIANGHLCVTDKAGTRCRVYDMQSGDCTFVRELPPLAEADRGLVGPSGKVYVSGRDEQSGATGILVYAPQGDSAVYEDVGTEGLMGKFHRPRGMYLYPGGTKHFAYFVNKFPFDVRRYGID